MPRLDYTVSEKWIIKLNDELMYHNDGFDQNRIYVGIEHRFSKKMSFEVGYMKLIQKRNGVDGYFDRNNLRMTFYKDFALK